METELKTIENIVSTSSEFMVVYGFQVLGAVIILLLGWFVSNYVAHLVLKVCGRFKLDITLSRFFAGIGKTVVLIFVILIALGKFGITITPFIAALGAIAFGGTLALQGPISNYGAGLTIILARPFVVGDTIQVLGVIGVVNEIKLAYTKLYSRDGELITIPNKHIIGEIIHNSRENLVVESEVGIDYSSDTDLAVQAIRNVLSNHPDVASSPEAQIGIKRFGDSSIDIAYRYWVPTRRYYQSSFDINNRILAKFREQGIHIPYPKRDVTVYSKNG